MYLRGIQLPDIGTLAIGEGTSSRRTGKHILDSMSNSIHSLIDFVGSSELGHICIRTLTHS